MSDGGRLRRLDDRLGGGPRLPPSWTAADGPLVPLDSQLDRVVPATGLSAVLVGILAVVGPSGEHSSALALVVVLGGALPLQAVATLVVSQRPDSSSLPARQVGPDVRRRGPALGALIAAAGVLAATVAALLLVGAGTGWFGPPVGLLLVTALYGMGSRLRLRRWQARTRRRALVRPGRYGTVRAGCYTQAAP